MDLAPEQLVQAKVSEEQRTLAGWLEILFTTTYPRALREEAVKRVTTAIIAKDVEIARLDRNLLQLNVATAGHEAELERLRRYQRQVMNAATPEGYAIVDESVLPLEQRRQPATLVPLRLVRPEGP